MTKKILIGIYSLVIIILIARAEFITWPLLDSDLTFKRRPHPIHGATYEGSLSSESTRKALSTYREGFERQGRVTVPQAGFKDFKILWKVENLNNRIHKASKSSPAVDQDGFYIADDSGYLRAYNWQGNLRWQFYSGVSSRGIHSTPLTDQDSVYFGDYAGYIYSLDKSNGKIRWITKAGITIGSSPLLVNDTLYVGVELADPDGFLLALEARTGKWKWTSEFTGNHPHASPVFDQKNGLLIMGSNSGEMKAYDIADGKTKWIFKTGRDIKCAGALQNGKMYFASWDGFVYSLASESGTLQWKSPLDDGSMSCPSLNADGTRLAIAGYKKNFVLDTADGKVLWSRDILNQEVRSQASPLILTFQANESVIFLCELGSVCIQDLKTGAIQQAIKLQDSFSASPVYFNGYLLLATTAKDGLLILNQ